MTLNRTAHRLTPAMLALVSIQCIERHAPEHRPETVELITRYHEAERAFERAVARERLTAHVGQRLSRNI